MLMDWLRRWVAFYREFEGYCRAVLMAGKEETPDGVLTGKAKEESDARWASVMEQARRAFNRRTMERRVETDCYSETGLYELRLLDYPGERPPTVPWAEFCFVDESHVFLFPERGIGFAHTPDMGRPFPTMAQRWEASPAGQKQIRETFVRHRKEIAHAD